MDLTEGADPNETFLAEGANFIKDFDARGHVDLEVNEVAAGPGAVHSEDLVVYGVWEDDKMQAQIRIEYMS